jgi:chromosome segregation ATPase
MRRTVILFSATLFFTVAARSEQPGQSDHQVTQTLLNEVRQLRQDLQVMGATIQRIQIVMYRLQVQGDLLNRATQRCDTVQNECRYTPERRKMLTAQIEHLESRVQDLQNSAERAATTAQIAQFRSALESVAAAERECQAQLVEAETQFRAEQAKMTDLQDQLDRLDRILAAQGSK